MTSADAALADGLRVVLGDALGSFDVAIAELCQLTGGASRQTWSFTATTPDGAASRLIALRDPPERPRQSTRAQARAMELAHEAGVPEPRIIAHSDDPALLGAPFIVMEFVDGETVPRRILRDDEFATARDALAEQCGEILARIHSIAPREIPELRSVDVLAELRETLDFFSDASPQLELGVRWLEGNRPAANPPSLVHGDFRNGNLMVGPDGVRAVLDWEQVHSGDPMEDLGYLCVRAWRFGGEKPVGGFGDYEDLFRGYARVSGRAVDPEVVRWWEVAGTVRWGVWCMQQAWRHLSGREASVELAAVGRRVWEQEYDVMLLVGDSLARI